MSNETEGKVWNGRKGVWEDKDPQPPPEHIEPTGPFEPRTEVSADAHHIAQWAGRDADRNAGRIIKHLWIIFVLLPVVLAILYSLLK
jgi:hypothetical protein